MTNRERADRQRSRGTRLCKLGQRNKEEKGINELGEWGSCKRRPGAPRAGPRRGILPDSP